MMALGPSMAKIVKFGQDPQTKAFAILDEDQTGHAEWHNLLESAPAVTPGDSLVVEWNEMYSVGSGNFRQAIYPALPRESLQISCARVGRNGRADRGGSIGECFCSTNLFGKRPGSGASLVIAITAMTIGISRYFVWHRMRREMVRLKQQRALEQERLRIAHDIHDDLGARITQISLLSAMSQGNPAFPDKARADFDKVSNMSRDLVSGALRNRLGGQSGKRQSGSPGELYLPDGQAIVRTDTRALPFSCAGSAA